MIPLGGNSAARWLTWMLAGAALLFWIAVISTGKDWREALHILEGDAKVKSQDRVIAYAHWGLYWGCLLNAMLCTGLAATARWWAAAVRPGQSIQVSRLSRMGWTALFAILILAGTVRWLRLDLSLYNDEAHNFRRYFSGYFQQRSDGTTRWREPSWGETLWLNQVGNNSTPFSVSARLSHAAALRLTGAPVGTVHEVGLRFPSWVAGLVTLMVVWALLRRLFPGSGTCWWGMLLLGLHPWHVRYSAEARGYAFMMLGVALCLYFALRAWQENRWRWWVAMGLAQFFALWSFSGTLYYLVAFNGLFLLGWIWRVWKGRQGWGQLWGPLFGMVVGAMCAVPLLLPMLPQLLKALQTNVSIHGHMGWGWWQDLAGCLVAGVRWVDSDPGNPVNLALGRFLSQQPWIWAGVVSVGLLVILGSVALVRAGGVAWVILVAGPLAVFGGWLAMGRQGNFIHLWYLLHVLVGWCVVLAAAGKFGNQRPWQQGVVIFLMTIVLTGWLWLDLRFHHLGKEDLRGVAQAVPAGAFHAAAYSDVDIYDRGVVIIEQTSELDPLIARARQENRVFCISFSRKIADPEFEKMFHRIEQGEEFEKIATLWGQEEGQFTHYLYKLK
ncbi:glycosyltransferase family 39 protein [Verrucomicrobium sp. BvORR034]|uniref:glycosyltransferase family 39 protein n=1 Tax=Verrucomicrobium sp. BvORR034 TaxID=1396418 RepID=UPI00067976AC|nr:glycosyltransferase family 39 protein [Verrucomicrobium sp. BvORR034]